MHREVTLFLGMFTTLLAIINPLEALPVFLKLLEGKADAYHCQVARRACLYAMLLAFFWVCPTFYTRSGPVICGPFSINSAMSRERYLIA